MINTILVRATLVAFAFSAPLLTQTALASEPASSARPAILEEPGEPPIPTSPEEEETRLTKNWGGLRSRLSDRGVDLALIYKGQIDSVISGGLERGTTTMTNLDLRLGLDLEKLLSWKGTSAFIYGLINHGNELSSYVGDKQVTSNIEAAKDITKLYEAWIQQVFAAEKASILFGLHDLNSEFYVNDTATLFFNSSFGVGKDLSQTGVSGPSIFPTTSVALRVRAEPSSSFYLQAGAFDAVPTNLETPVEFRLKASDGALVIAEGGYVRGKEEGSKDQPLKISLGAWAYSRTTPHLLSALDPNFAPGVSQGAYLLYDHSISKLFAHFVRWGVASSTTNAFSSDASYGMTFTGLIPSRNKDRLGLAVTRAGLGSEYRELQSAGGVSLLRSETTFELTYRAALLRGIAFQPDAQYVFHPSADPMIPNAVVCSARLEVSF